MEVKVVFFDAGNTLIYPDPPVGEVYAGALREAGLSADGDEVQQQFDSAWRRLRREQTPGGLEYGATESEAMGWWRRVARESLKPFGAPADFEEMFLALWNHFLSASAWRVYADVFPTFEGLERSGRGIGLISNWDVRLMPLLGELGLRERLRWTVVSCQVGAEKPDRAIFQRALDECAVPAQSVLHVGDSYVEDVVGARNAGLHAVWLRRDGQGVGASDDVEVIGSLVELLDLLG